MNNTKLIPELHDIFKLTEYGHINTYDSSFPIDLFQQLPSNQTVEGILRHHTSEGFKHLPNSPETLILCISDNLAASFSRTRTELGRTEKHIAVQKLWKNFCSIDIPFVPVQEIISFLASDPSEKDIDNYKDILKKRSEDAYAVRSITSLYTHLKLTGKFYRILSSNENFLIDARNINGMPDTEVPNYISKLQNKWQLTILKCKFFFPQKPIRAVDLNVYIFLQEYIRKLEKEFSDNILLATSDEILMVGNNKEEMLNNFKKVSDGRNFMIETISACRSITELNPNPEDNPRPKRQNYYIVDIPETISIPICPICQSSPANKQWERETIADEVIIEEICDSCFAYREMGTRLPKLYKWELEGNSKLLWLKIDLDFQKLSDTLNVLYKDYLCELKAKEILELNQLNEFPKVRFSVISEFQEDYTEFLINFTNNMTDLFGEENIQQILDNFFCIKENKKKRIFDILEIYRTLGEEIFPKFFEIENCPILFNLAYANIKFPFFEIWKILNTSKEEVNIFLVGQGEINTKAKFIEEILIASSAKYNKSSLHKLAEISKIYEILAQLQFKDKMNRRDYPTYNLLNKNLLPLGMDFKSILTFAKILEISNEESRGKF